MLPFFLDVNVIYKIFKYYFFEGKVPSKLSPFLYCELCGLSLNGQGVSKKSISSLIYVWFHSNPEIKLLGNLTLLQQLPVCGWNSLKQALTMKKKPLQEENQLVLLVLSPFHYDTMTEQTVIPALSVVHSSFI